MVETRKTVISHIVEKRTGFKDYDGPFSHLGEYHAAEFGFKYGLVTGLYQEAPGVATGAATLVGASTVRKFADTGVPKYAKMNAIYVVVFFLVGLLVGAALGPVMPSIA